MAGETGLRIWKNGEMSWEPFDPSPEMIEEFKKERAARDASFLEYGIDRKALTDFVIGSAEPISGQVLDIGTGKGLAAVEIARRGHDVVTIDPDVDTVRMAIVNAVSEEVDPMIEFHIADVNDMPFENGRFNLAIMVNVIHHLEDASNVLAEVSRVLAPGGRFLFCDFTDKGFEILGKIHGDEGHSHTHHVGETVESLAEKLADYGMRCIGRDRRHHQQLVVAKRV